LSFVNVFFLCKVILFIAATGISRSLLAFLGWKYNKKSWARLWMIVIYS
jgi:hypothetical protein